MLTTRETDPTTHFWLILRWWLFQKITQTYKNCALISLKRRNKFSEGGEVNKLTLSQPGGEQDWAWFWLLGFSSAVCWTSACGEKGLKTSLNVNNLFIPSHLSGEQLLQKFPLAPLVAGHSQPHGIINLSSMLWIRTGVCFQRDVPEIPFVQEASPAAFLRWGSAATFPSFKPILVGRSW